MNSLLLYFMSLSIGSVVSLAFLSLLTSVGLFRYIDIYYGVKKYRKFLGYAVTLGLVAASVVLFYDTWSLYWGFFGQIIAIIMFLFYGILIGYLALALAEVFDVIPIINNKIGFRFSLPGIILALAFGKFVGAIVYFCVPGFYKF